MKLELKISSIWFFLFLTYYSSLSLAQCQKKLFVIAWNHYEPFLYQGKNKQVTGLDTLVVKEVFKRAGCNYRFIEMPWKRSLVEIKQGNLDMLPTASITDERKQFALFSESYRDEEYRIVIRKGEAKRWPLGKILDMVSLEMRVSMELGAWLGVEFDKASKNEKFSRLILQMPLIDDSALKMLIANHVDGIMMEPPTANFKAKKFQIIDKIEIHPYVVNADPVYFMFSKKSVVSSDVDIINRALLEYKKTADYKKIYNFYK